MNFFKPALVTIALALCASCQTMHTSPVTSTAPAKPATPAKTATPASTTPAAVKATTPAPAPTPAVALPTIRIDAGSATPYKDAAGNTWAADTGFTDGDVVDRGAIAITNTADAAIYRTEHYGMAGFSQKVPNGSYIVKLHFAETYDGITGAGQRVFSVTVEGKEIKDIDPWAKAGGAMKAYVETVPVEVKDGSLDIVFTAGVQNAAINGIEIIPAK